MLFRRRSFSLVEIALALALLGILLAATTSAWFRSSRASQVHVSKGRVEALCMEAFRISAISGRRCEVSLSKMQNGSWRAILNLRAQDAALLTSFAQRLTSLTVLPAIEEVFLNERKVSMLNFLFFGGYGLAEVVAADEFGNTIPPAELQLVATWPAPKKAQTAVRLCGAGDMTEHVALEAYVLSIPSYQAFPEGTLDAS